MVEAGRQDVTTGGYDHNRILRSRNGRLNTADMELRTGGYDNRVLFPTGRSVDGELTTGGYEDEVLTLTTGRHCVKGMRDGTVRGGGRE
jgi:hypothetical protein